ncbi:hypothetical protein [Mucilaginibacter sp. HD30]
MYINTAMEIMNNANIVLDFFEPINGVVHEPAKGEQGEQKQ